ncbi:MAG: tetratricopeptide repeat protein [Candidatus Contendobacter sp.]|nr:tetratricopeptide repeat protein [Candidatus Contendobacter sp.]
MRPRSLSLAVFSLRLEPLFAFLLLVIVFGGLPLSTATAQDSAIGLLKQMIAIAADNGGVGRTEELNALKQQIAALPKPARGDTKKAQEANAKGLEAIKAGQPEQAKQQFQSAYQLDPANAEYSGNLGFAYIKTGDLKAALKAFSTALSLAPGRASSWANLAEVYALQGQQREAVACYALTFHFSQNQNKTREFLQKQTASADDPKIQQAAQQALQLSLIQGSGGTVAAAPAEDSLDAPLPPAALPASRSLSAAPPPAPMPAASPVVATTPPVPSPAPPPVVAATPPVAAPPAAPVPPPAAPAASVATSPIPASLLPAASPKAEAGAVAPAPGNDTAAAGSGNSDLVEVVAQGMGTDQSSALNNAYSNAVQQALGLYVDAETMVQNDQIVRDQILTYSKGFIQKADIVSQSQANGLFQVNIRAKVQRQKLLEKAKASSITIKQVEGVSLHAQVETQIKQEQDAKALLEKTLQPLMDATLLRAELLPNTKEQPNPTINKAGTNDQFVTLDYEVSLWIDESEYYKYVKNTLIPVLNQIALRKGELTVNYKVGYEKGTMVESVAGKAYDENQESSFSVLIWGDKALSASKWQWFALSVDKIPDSLEGRRNYNKDGDRIRKMLCRKAIELNLLDEKGETVALASSVVSLDNMCDANGGSISPMALDDYRKQMIITSPYLTSRFHGGERTIFPPKSVYFTLSVKISKEDIPRVKTAKLEVKSPGE